MCILLNKTGMYSLLSAMIGSNVPGIYIPPLIAKFLDWPTEALADASVGNVLLAESKFVIARDSSILITNVEAIQQPTAG